MKNMFKLLPILLFVTLSVNASVKIIRSPEALKDMVINCHTDYSIIVEFPQNSIIKGIESGNPSASQWVVDHDLNLLWAQPTLKKSADCTIRVKTDQYEDIILKFRSVEDSTILIHTIVLEKKVFMEKKKIILPAIGKNRIFKETRRENSVDLSIPITSRSLGFTGESNKFSPNSIGDKNSREGKHKNSFVFDTLFSLTGGTQSFGDSSFNVDGELIVALKKESGLFFQGAGKLNINKMVKEFGFSVGFGFEREKLGFFLFADGLSHKFGKLYDSTLHLQVRPAIRYRLSDKVHISGFFAFPIGAWQYTGVEVAGNSGFGYYNKSLLHGGLDLSVYLEKLFVDLRALIAEGKAFGIDLKAGYELIKKIFVTVNYSYQTSGDYDYIKGISNTSAIGLGVTFNMGKMTNRAKDRIIFRPDYPMVVVAEKKLDEEKKSAKPAISLAADPTTGYAPLNVSYKASLKGFNGEVEMTWYFNATFKSTSKNSSSAFTYDVPGTYKCYVVGKDTKGNTATSNIVEVRVLSPENNDDTFLINATVRSGSGSISPNGKKEVKFGECQTYEMKPASGWHTNSVYVDGKNIGAVSKYEFKNCKKNHTIEVVFTQTPPSTFNINAKAENGGSIDPASTEVTAGSNVTLTITTNEGYEINTVTVDGKAVSVSGNELTLTNIQSNHNVVVTFKLKSYVITGSVRNNRYGTINPVSATVQHGSTATITFTPEDGNKHTIRYWLNGKVTNQEGVGSITINNVTSNQNVIVEFDWIYFNVSVSLEKIDPQYPCDATLDPRVGTFRYRKGSNLVFNCTPGEWTKIESVLLSGRKYDATNRFRIDNLNKDYDLIFQIKRRLVKVSANIMATGCVFPGTVSCSYGGSQSGSGHRTYNVPIGMPVTFYFDYEYPYPVGVDGYELTTEKHTIIGPLPRRYTIASAQEGQWIHVKCLLDTTPPEE